MRAGDKKSGLAFEKHVTRENTVPRDRAGVVECAADPSKGQL